MSTRALKQGKRKSMKPGGTSKPLSIDLTQTSDRVAWRAYFQAAIAGVCAAQRRNPNPKDVARWAQAMADIALAHDRCRDT